MGNQSSDEDAGEAGAVMTADELADRIALKVLDRLMAITTFPTAEDVERIRDHVSPNGVAYQNGKKDERKQVAAWLKLQPRWADNADLAAMIEAGDHWK